MVYTSYLHVSILSTKETRTIDPLTKLCKICTLKVKQNKPLVNWADSFGQIILIGSDQEDNENDNENAGAVSNEDAADDDSDES